MGVIFFYEKHFISHKFKNKAENCMNLSKNSPKIRKMNVKTLPILRQALFFS